MKRWGSLLLAMVLVLAAAGFAFAAEGAGNRADAVGFGVTLYLETPLSEGDAQALFDQGRSQEDATAFSVWGELAGQRILDPDLGRSVRADVLAIRGNPQILLAQANGLSEGDGTGCLIGEETAWELFGSTEVIGDEICIGKATRRVHGVIRQPGSGVIVTGDLKGVVEEAEQEEFSCYDRITLASRKTADGEAFLMQNALEGEVLRFDYLRSLSWFFELVPGKWSDFSGWKENYKRKQQDFDLIMQVHKNSVEIYYEKQCMVLIWNWALEIICVWAAVVYLLKASDGGMRLWKRFRRAARICIIKKR